MLHCSFSVLCSVDLSGQRVSLQIEKVGSDPYCEMSLDSKVEEKMNVAAGSKASLSFLDCPNEEVRLTASEVIGKIIIIILLKQGDCYLNIKNWKHQHFSEMSFSEIFFLFVPFLSFENSTSCVSF